jgi:HAD superfamily hydrolase (TIGR01549 family)
LLKHFGKKKISFEDYHENYWGVHIKEEIKKIFRNISQKELSKILDYYNKNSSQFIQKQKLYPQVKNILEELKKKYKLALVTSTLTELTKKILQHFSLRNYFNIVINGEMIENPKPAPDAVLLACKKLRIKPEEAVYVGDNFQDVEAGKRSECFTVAITTTSSKEELKDADKIINNLNELIKVIG